MVALVRGSEVRFVVRDDGLTAVAIDCSHQGGVRFFGRVLFSCPGTAGFTVSPRGDVIEGFDPNLQTPDDPGKDGGGKGDDSPGGDEDERDGG